MLKVCLILLWKPINKICLQFWLIHYIIHLIQNQSSTKLTITLNPVRFASSLFCMFLNFFLNTVVLLPAVQALINHDVSINHKPCHLLFCLCFLCDIIDILICNDALKNNQLSIHVWTLWSETKTKLKSEFYLSIDLL